MRICYNKILYSKAALLKAAYHFTSDYYIYLDQNDTEYIVEINAKTGVDNASIKGLFSNEMLAQVTREEIIKQTSHIRELVLGRAFASTIIEVDDSKEKSLDEIVENSFSVNEIGDKIFNDWYENNDV